MSYYKNEYGDKAFSVDMVLGINKKVIVTTAWQIDKGKSFPKSLLVPTQKRKRGGENMVDLYDRVKVKKSSFLGNVVSISDNQGKDAPIYYVEIDDEYKVGDFLKDMIWCKRDEIELIKKF